MADAGLIKLTSSAYDVELRGVEHLHYADGTGDDQTTIADTAANDLFTAGATNSVLERSDGSTVTLAADVDRLVVRSIGGSADRAVFLGTQHADTFSSRPAEQLALRHNSISQQIVLGFEVVEARANDPTDRAVFYDTPAADTFVGRLNVSVM